MPHPSEPSATGTPSAGAGGAGSARRPLLRRLAVPIAASLMLHALGLAALYTFDLLPTRSRSALTAHQGEDTALAIELSELPPAPPPPPITPPTPEPPPEPAPEPEPEPTPEVMPEPPVQEALIPEPAPTPKPAPPPRPVSTPVPAPSAPATISPPRAAAVPRPSVDAPTVHSAVFASLKAERATKIVYCVDVSGSMASVLPFLTAELRASVDRLASDQSFQVVLFRDPPEGSGSRSVQTLYDRGTLVAPAGETKRALAALLGSERPLGRSNITAGLRRALEMKPTLIFLLTRNFKRTADPDIDATLRELDTLNPKGRDGLRPATIKIIQFIEDDPTGLLQAIAKEHGTGDDAYSMLEIDQLREP